MSTRVAHSAGALTSGSNPITKPSGTVEGDLIIAVINSSAAITVKPSGWTELRYAQLDASDAISYWTWIGYRVAEASEPSSYSYTTGSGDKAWVAHSYRPGVYGWASTPSVLTFTYDSTSDTAWVVPTATATTAAYAMAVVSRFGIESFSASAVNNGFSLRHAGASDAATGIFTADKTVSAGAIGATTFTGGVAARTAGYMIVVYDIVNVAPNTGTPTYPVGGVSVNLNDVQRFRSTFSDPDVGDTQSQLDIRYKVVGAGSWTTVQTVTPNPYVDFAAGTFTANNYEWQSLHYDAQGVPAASWSASAFFTAAVPATDLAITAPTNGGTVATSTATVTWSTPSQQSYQVRRVADSSGTPVTGTVYYDSGEVVSTVTRSVVLTFETNGRDEHIQVRKKEGGLWTSWESVLVSVDYDEPATPTITVDDISQTGAIRVWATHPTPTGAQPAVTSMDIYRREVGDSSSGIRVAAGLFASVVFIDWAVASGVAYEYRVKAIGTSGTSSFSDWSDDGSGTIPGFYGGLYS